MDNLAVSDATPPAPPADGEEGGAAGGGGGDLEVVDPALWYCHTVNRLQLKLAPGALTSLRDDGLARLTGWEPG